MHPTELKVNLFLQNALEGKTTITEEVADKVASDVRSAMLKQFSGGPRDDFRLRMSNIGKPTCQLWSSLSRKYYPDRKRVLLVNAVSQNQAIRKHHNTSKGCPQCNFSNL